MSSPNTVYITDLVGSIIQYPDSWTPTIIHIQIKIVNKLLIYSLIHKLSLALYASLVFGMYSIGLTYLYALNPLLSFYLQGEELTF